MSTLNNISVDGTVYNINDFHVIKNNSYNNPFIITEHEPGIYIVDSSEADYLPGKLYAKYIDSEDYNVRTEYYDGFLCLTDTSIDDPYTYKNIGYIFDASAGLAHPCVTQPAPRGFSLTGTSSGIGNSAVKTIGNQTINGKKVFNTLPESSVIPTTNNQLVNKKYVDDLIPTQTILTDTLTAGNTTLTFKDSSILTSSLIDVYTDTFGVNPTNMTSSTGELILTFPAQTDDIDVKVVIR